MKMVIATIAERIRRSEHHSAERNGHDKQQRHEITEDVTATNAGRIRRTTSHAERQVKRGHAITTLSVVTKS